LRDGPGWEWLDVPFGAIYAFFVMPAGESCEEEETDKSEDYCDDDQIWEDDLILKLTCEPDQIQGILIDAHLVCQRSGIITTQPSSSIWIDTDAKVADSCF